MKNFKILLLLVTALLGASLIFGGCTAAKKPMAPSSPTTPKATSPAADQNYPKEIADRVVKEANQVDGVEGSTAVISGKNIYLGLDLAASLEKNRSAQVEKNVLDRVKDMQPGYTVSVTSDIDTVTRIKRVAQGITQGKTISSFSKELQDIGTRIQPRTK